MFGFSLAELLLGFNPRYLPGYDEFEDFVRSMSFSIEEVANIVEGLIPQAAYYEERLAKIDDIRQAAVDKRLEMGDELVEKTLKDKDAYQEGDLVRLRRLD